MPWVDRVDIHTLLNKKRIRGSDVIHYDHQQKKCIYWSRPKGRTPLVLGSEESIKYMRRKDVSRFTIGSWDLWEVEYFQLLKDQSGTWYAYMDECDKMFRIADLRQLDYSLVTELVREFRNRCR